MSLELYFASGQSREENVATLCKFCEENSNEFAISSKFTKDSKSFFVESLAGAIKVAKHDDYDYVYYLVDALRICFREKVSLELAFEADVLGRLLQMLEIDLELSISSNANCTTNEEKMISVILRCLTNSLYNDDIAVQIFERTSGIQRVSAFLNKNISSSLSHLIVKILYMLGSRQGSIQMVCQSARLSTLKSLLRTALGDTNDQSRFSVIQVTCQLLNLLFSRCCVEYPWEDIYQINDCEMADEEFLLAPLMLSIIQMDSVDHCVSKENVNEELNSMVAPLILKAEVHKCKEAAMQVYTNINKYALSAFSIIYLELFCFRFSCMPRKIRLFHL